MNNQTATQTITNQEFVVNNMAKKIKTSELIEKMEERQSRRFDRYDSLGALYESVRAGEVELSENATNQFFGKLNLDKSLSKRLNPSTWDSVIAECVAEADSKAKLNGLMRYEKSLDGRTIVRAVLSKDYAKLDSTPIVKAAQKLVGDEIIIRDFVDDDNSTRLSLIIGEPISLGTIDNKPDIYWNIMSISNSETGNRSLSVNMGIWRMWCLNGAMSLQSQLGISNIRHYGDKNQTFGEIENLNAAKMIENNMNIIDMYKVSKGIWIPKSEAETVMEGYVENADLTKKMVESAKTLRMLKYNDSGKASMFNVYNSITEAIHRGTTNIHTRFERESKAYAYTQKIVDAYVKA